MHNKYFSSSRQFLVAFILRVALAFALIYSAILGFFHPFEWINYFPSFLRSIFPDAVILNLFGLSELVLGAWLVWGKKIFIPSVLASFYLLASIIFNLDQFNNLFEDVSVLGIALALAILSYPRIIVDRNVNVPR